jgi:two-component system nitrogen regulation response regulator GlnG
MKNTDIDRRLREILPGNSRAIRACRRGIRLACSDRRPLVVIGEAGSPREAVARFIHGVSPRTQGEFLSGTLDEIPVHLARFRSGVRAILYIDAPECQPDERESLLADVVRLFPPPVRPILSLVAEATEEEREYAFAGNGCPVPVVAIPPLRRRRDDLPHMLAAMLEAGVADGLALSSADLRFLANGRWPGNDEELVRWSAERETGGGDGVKGGRRSGSGRNLERELGAWIASLMAHGQGQGVLRQIVRQVERMVIVAALDGTGGNQVQAARLLGINRNTLAVKVIDHDLDGKTRSGRLNRRR